MKTLIVAATVLVSGVLTSSVTSVHIDSNFNKSNDLYACIFFPLCDRDAYSPATPMNEEKVHTEDAKDEKVA